MNDNRQDVAWMLDDQDAAYYKKLLVEADLNAVSPRPAMIEFWHHGCFVWRVVGDWTAATMFLRGWIQSRTFAPSVCAVHDADRDNGHCTCKEGK